MPVHLIHARETSGYAWSPLMMAPPDDQRWLLDEARERVREAAPELVITSEQTTISAPAALEAASREADTLVVGARGHGALGSLVLGSTSLHVAGHASCPVVVVCQTRVPPTAPSRRVVVGIDGSALSVDALGYAFAAASQRHLPLEVVTAWDPALLATYRLEGTVADEVLAAAGNQHLGTAQEAVAPWQEKYPDVPVHVHVGTDAPAETLIERSDGAALTVVGSRGLGSVRGLLSARSATPSCTGR